MSSLWLSQTEQETLLQWLHLPILSQAEKIKGGEVYPIAGKESFAREVELNYWRLHEPEKFERYQERAAIMEYCGGLRLEDAERQAFWLIKKERS